MSAAPTPTRERAHPRSPLIGLAYFLGWTIAFIAALALFIARFEDAIGFDLYGRRTEGFILVTPWIYLPLAILTGIRALLAIGPWVAYRSRTTPDQRRRDRGNDLTGSRPPIPALVFGIILLVGGAGLVFTGGANALLQGPSAAGLGFLVSMGMGCLIVGATIVGHHVHVVRYSRFRDPAHLAADAAEAARPKAPVPEDEWLQLRMFVRDNMAGPLPPAPRWAMTPVGGIVASLFLLVVMPLVLLVPTEMPIWIGLLLVGVVAVVAIVLIVISAARLGRWSEGRRLAQHWIAYNGGTLPPELRVF